MRLPVPAPRDVIGLLERGAGSVEQLLAAVPRMVALLGDAESLLARVHRLVDDIDGTRTAADELVDRADALLGRVDPLTQRIGTVLDAMEPPLTTLAPTLERLAETTDPHEVEALVKVIDHLPRIADKLETDIMPILDTLNTVAPDLHDLLDVSRELNEMLAQVPGLSRMKKRVDRQQVEDGRG